MSAGRKSRYFAYFAAGPEDTNLRPAAPSLQNAVEVGFTRVKIRLKSCTISKKSPVRMKLLWDKQNEKAESVNTKRPNAYRFSIRSPYKIKRAKVCIKSKIMKSGCF
jgi:hypothetical protein